MYYTIKNLHDKAEVLIYGEIGLSENDSKSLATEIKNLESQYNQIDVRINSDGGIVTEGIAIYNALINSTATIHTYNDGVAASMASGILMAGDKIYAGSNTMLMIHKISGIAMGQSDELRNTADTMEKFEDNSLIPMYAERTGKTVEQIRNEWMNGTDQWFSAQEALDQGLIDEMVEPRAKKVAKTDNRNIAAQMSQFQNALKSYVDGEEISDNVINKITKSIKNAFTGGPTLSSEVETAIQERVSNEENTNRADVIREMADAADIAESTVNSIVNGNIDCPPFTRLEGFARVLPKSETQLREAGNQDGCGYSNTNQTTFTNHKPEQMKDLIAKLAPFFTFTNVNTEDVEAVATAIKDEHQQLKNSYEQLKQEKEQLEVKLQEQEQSKVKEMLDNAQNQGKITAEQRKSYEEVAQTSSLDALKNIIDSLPAPKKPGNLTGSKNGNGEDEKGLRQLEKENPAEVQRLKNEEPETYVEKYQAEYGKTPKGFEAYAE